MDYDHYWEKIIRNDAVYSTAEELFLFRMAAFVKLGSDNESAQKIAERFLLETMLPSCNNNQLAQEKEFVSKVEHFDFPEITAHRSDKNLYAVAYKINYRVAGKDNALYEVSFFNKDAENKLVFAYKYNLGDLYHSYSTAIIDTKDMIRQLGDPVLASAGKIVTDFTQDCEAALSKQIEIAKKALIATGGVGIAANQCAEIAEPLRFALVGIDYTNPEHAIKALTRYPNFFFPQMIVCINPTVVSASENEKPFVEGCLSFRGGARASVCRPAEITVNYQQIDGSHLSETFSGNDAVVVQHEIDHILNGVVFIEKIIRELDPGQIKELLRIVQSINTPSFSPPAISAFQTPVPIFTRNADGKIEFDSDEAYRILSLTQKNALDGLERILM